MSDYYLKTERLGFSEWKEEFYPYASDLWGNTDVAKFITVDDIFSEEEIKERFNLEIQNKRLYNVQYYPLFLLEGDIFIGCCGFRPYDLKKSIYEFGFYLKPEFWSKGYATEAARSILEYTLHNIRMKNVYAGHHPDNVASKKVLEKLGFVYFTEEYYAPTSLFHPLYRLLPYNSP